MVFKPGNNMNPSGGIGRLRFAEALNVAVQRKDKNGKVALARIADKLVREALRGSAWAVQEVANRLDGKPRERVDVTTGPNDVVLELLRSIGRGDFDKARKDAMVTAATTGKATMLIEHAPDDSVTITQVDIDKTEGNA